MKRALLLALIGLSLSAHAPAAPAPRDRFVPVTVEQDGSDDHFYEDWIGGQLRAMREPNLSRSGSLGPFVTRLRLLVLPSFQHGYSIRVDEEADGSTLSFVELTGRGGYTPGHVRRRARAMLSAQAMGDLRRQVLHSGLLSAPATAPSPEPTGSADDPVLISCYDGTGFVFEFVSREGSHFVYRHDCEMPPSLRELANSLERLRRRAAR